MKKLNETTHGQDGFVKLTNCFTRCLPSQTTKQKLSKLEIVVVLCIASLLLLVAVAKNEVFLEILHLVVAVQLAPAKERMHRCTLLQCHVHDDGGRSRKEDNHLV